MKGLSFTDLDRQWEQIRVLNWQSESRENCVDESQTIIGMVLIIDYDSEIGGVVSVIWYVEGICLALEQSKILFFLHIVIYPPGSGPQIDDQSPDTKKKFFEMLEIMFPQW